ncbi:MAG: DUF3786 domain-containing protein [Deltaproteobacteria bacterium]|nr:DUF3786 domain-containing protein [Deltaproteobacteria bacterium]
MESNYAKIVKENLDKLYSQLPNDIEIFIPAERKGDVFEFSAFGGVCTIQPDGIFINAKKQDEAMGILVSLYALQANTEPYRLEPFKAFKEFPDSMPYIGAFTTHTENILLPHVKKIKTSRQNIIDRLGDRETPPDITGDFSFVVYPLPKIALCYIFYDADDDFPPSVTCLFSNNALSFLPIAAMADVGEYTSKVIIDMVQ